MTTIIISLLVIILVESVLSFDNAAVLSLIVNKKLKNPIEQKKALRWGMWGAFILRGLSLLIVSWLITNPWVGDWFRIIGGAYLLKLGYKGLTPEIDSVEEGEVGWADKLLNKLKISPFWSTVIVVELVDLVFSMDNLVAVVGLSDDIRIVCLGVFIGIVTMRYVATKFVGLIKRFPSLEMSAFVVILLLGIKLTLSGIGGIGSITSIINIMASHAFDIGFSVLMMLIFFAPILKTKLIK